MNSEELKADREKMKQDYCNRTFNKIMHETKIISDPIIHSSFEKKGRINIWRSFQRAGQYFIIERKRKFLLIFRSCDRKVASFVKRTKTFKESCKFFMNHDSSIDHLYLKSFQRRIDDQDEFYHMGIELCEKAKQIRLLFDKIEGNPEPKKETYENLRQLKIEMDSVFKHATYFRRTLQYFKDQLPEKSIFSFGKNTFKFGENYLVFDRSKIKKSSDYEKQEKQSRIITQGETK